MKIALFGATGRVGSEVLKRALADGHEVTVLARSPEKLESHDQLTIIKGNVRDEIAVTSTILDVDVVFSGLGTDKSTTLTEATPHIINAMIKADINRMVTIGTAGILQSRTNPEKLRYETADSKRKTTFAVEEHRKAYELIRQSTLDWTVICPTYLPDGDAVGDYRVEESYLPIDGKQITVGDTGSFAYEELLANNHVHARVGICY